jgi:hypothetical protein
MNMTTQKTQRKVDLHKGREILTRLDEIPDPIVSARRFVALNFDTLRQSGKTLKALYDFLQHNGMDLGTFESFRADYNSAKRARKKNPSEVTAPKEVKNDAQGVNEKHERNAEKKEHRPRGLELTPIRMADGTEVLIDPATGARHFKI